MGMDMGAIVMMMMMNDQAAQTRAENQRALDFQNRIISDAQAEKKAEQDRIAQKEIDRKATGQSGRGAYISNVKQRLSSGLIGEESAQKLVQDYYNQYDLAPDATELADITQAYQQFAPKRREADLSSVYQRLLGRPATAAELAAGQSQLALGRTVGDLEKDIESTSEYKNQRPSSAEEAKNEAVYGRPVLDPVTGLRTKTYKSYFSKTALPGVSDDLQKQIGIKAPSFIGEEFIGTADEIEYAKTQRNNYETFLYNSGLTALKGNLDKEISKYAQDQETERTGKNVKGQIDIEGIRQTGQKAISDFAQLEETRRTEKVVAGQKDVEDIRVRGQKEITEQTIKGDIRRNREQQAYGLLQGVVGSFNF
jgi:hypothetical protein